MRLDTDKDGNIILKEIDNLSIETADGEVMGLNMRDSGFEIYYEGRWYSAKKGELKELSQIEMEVQAENPRFKCAKAVHDSWNDSWKKFNKTGPCPYCNHPV